MTATQARVIVAWMVAVEAVLVLAFVVVAVFELGPTVRITL